MEKEADLKLTSELPPDTRYGNSYLYVRLVTRHPANRHLSQDQQTSTYQNMQRNGKTEAILSSDKQKEVMEQAKESYERR